MEVTRVSEVVSFCQELVREPSLSGQEAGVADLVQREMRMLGYDHISVDRMGNVVGTVLGTRRGKRLLIDGHMDTVPVVSPESWRHQPYSGERADGRIWGRGATDVKGSLAAALVAAGSLCGRDFAGEVLVCASVGEEMTEGVALEHVMRAHPVDAVVIAEPTKLRLGIGHKGRTGIVLEAEGVSAHSSEPERGDNAVYRMIEAISRVREIPPQDDPALGRGVCELVEIISSPYPGTSMVPHRCTARFDRRLVRSETVDNVLDEMSGAVVEVEGLSVRYHKSELSCYTGLSRVDDDFHSAWALSADSAVVRTARRALDRAGICSDLVLAPFCTNGCASAGTLGIPTVIYGAGSVADCHVVDESVSVEALHAAYNGYLALITALASQ